MAVTNIKLDPSSEPLFRGLVRVASSSAVSGAELQTVYELLFAKLTGDGLPKYMRDIGRWTLLRIGAYELAEKLCDFNTFSEWTIGSLHPPFMQQFPRVKNDEDRRELLDQHRRWGEWLEKSFVHERIDLTSHRQPGKWRIGLISSSLYNHVAGQFALPLFQHVDPNFELFAYSRRTVAPDDVENYMARRSNFIRLGEGQPIKHARRIAEDDLDLLIDMDGLTGANSLQIMAHKPARKQASWLGYPHSTGLSAIDYIILDPNLSSSLTLEQSIFLPQSWITLPEVKFDPSLSINSELPEKKNGFLTFGTLASPFKYTPHSINVWAKILTACPGSKFMFCRPEAGAPSFQRGMIKRFSVEGVTPDRLIFREEFGHPSKYYADIDISLDTFPITGGTTTADALWMGVPVISLVGAGISERLSYSLLTNAGLSELAVTNIEDYKAVAIWLAHSPERRAELRTAIRRTIKDSSLGDPPRFAAEFYGLMQQTLEINQD